jgi:dTDP-4-dehydrorhamnose reductase
LDLPARKQSNQVIVYLFFRQAASLTSLACAPLGIFALGQPGFSIGLALAPLGMLYQDISRGLGVLLPLFMYLTPVVYPTWARMLVETTGLLLARGGEQVGTYFKPHAGVYHVAGQGGVSRFEWAQAILAQDPDREGQRAKRLEPARGSEFPTPAARPANTVLNCAHFENTFGLRLPAWMESLQLALGK